MKHRLALVSLLLVVLTITRVPGLAAAQGDGRSEAPAGQLTWAVAVALAPVWFDPAEATGLLTPFKILYALHDALVKPMPGTPMAPSLAESWSVSADGLIYDFVLRQGVRFHNGDLLTADDVKFSFERYRGVSAKVLKDRVRQIRVVDPHRVRFQLKEPWPDFLTFYATPATGAGWIVPSKYVEKVGDEGFKKAPVGAGPYRFVSFTPGVELVLDAYEQYWRKSPSVRRLVLKVVPDGVTRAAMPKRGEVDIAYALRGAIAEDVRRRPGLGLKPAHTFGGHWVLFTEQWAQKSLWADPRVREKKLRPFLCSRGRERDVSVPSLDSLVAAGGLYTYGSYPDIEGNIHEQDVERDRKRREATLHRIQQRMHERVMFAPVWEIAVLNGYGPRVAEPALSLIAGHLFSAPYEEVRLKGR